MKTKKAKVEPINSREFMNKMVLENENVTERELMVAFAKLKVTEALEETSKHFKNPENVSHVKNHYKLDKIV